MTTPIPHVVPGVSVVRASAQNALIDRVNENTADIVALEQGGVGGGLSAEEAQGLIDTTVGTHVADTTPHPAYDDLPSLRLLFENGLV